MDDERYEQWQFSSDWTLIAGSIGVKKDYVGIISYFLHVGVEVFNFDFIQS